MQHYPQKVTFDFNPSPWTSSDESDGEMHHAANAIVVLNALPVAAGAIQGIVVPPPPVRRPAPDRDVEPGLPHMQLYSRTYSFSGGTLHFPANSIKGKMMVEITNKKEGLSGNTSMERHNACVLGKEGNSLYAAHAGKKLSNSSRQAVGAMPFLFVMAMHGLVGDFIMSLPLMPNTDEAAFRRIYWPQESVINVLHKAYSGLFGFAFRNFRPTFSAAMPAVCGDVLFKVWWYFAILVGHSVNPLYYFNLLHVDPRTFWDTYSEETGASRHWLVGGDWYFRFKVTRGHRYLVHIVLRGTFEYKVAGHNMFTLKTGDAVVHPLKYYMRLIPMHARSSADVLTIII